MEIKITDPGALAWMFCTLSVCSTIAIIWFCETMKGKK